MEGMGRADSRLPTPDSREGRNGRVAALIDHTLLAPEATTRQIASLCDEARAFGFAAVCVNGSWVDYAVARLRDSGVLVASVVGFPLGATATVAKASEARALVDLGADELDMVAPIGRVIDEDWDEVEADIRAVVEAAAGRTVKVILETAALEPAMIVKAAAIAKDAGAGFVKTSTGFHPAGGATEEAVALLRAAVGPDIGVKASGGIRDVETVLQMIEAGATRIGTSAGPAILEGGGAGKLTADS